ncbi:Alpha/Beta hydrolase protein [Epithele typhae]|uniref:Alpha/Beta hydrolase protein n=1 Tax=Epithele typhae TaxID=378194 RepID=UPI002007A0D3|nr:Alpha/Beta hydrolase protein [Epithele typhae]KAH9934520.1 Alpha/Beta hydrolase protein [Epithele typhae]
MSAMRRSEISVCKIVSRSFREPEPLLLLQATDDVRSFAERTALRWIQRYIRNFGGDPTKVTLIGLSSGAVSAGFHTVYNDGENLFRALWAESGAIQPRLDRRARAPGGAVTNTSAVNSLWSPRADGAVFLDLPQKLLTSGRAHNVPVVAGNAEDEGTLFSLNIPGLTSDAEFLQTLLSTGWFGNLSAPQGPQLLDLYSNDPALGAPYGTGDDFQYEQMHKRFASVVGDATIDAVRRLFSREMSKKNHVWSYLYRRHKVAGFGSTHGSEIPEMYQTVGSQLQDLFIHFANTLDPNGTPGVAQAWPKYSEKAPVLLDFSGNSTLRLTDDTYRGKQIDFLVDLSQQYPWPLQ